MNNQEGSTLHNLDADLETAGKMLETCERDSLFLFNDAIKACLTPYAFPRDASFEDESFQLEFYSKVLRPIELVLLQGYGIDVLEQPVLSSITSPDPDIQYAQSNNQKNKHQAVFESFPHQNSSQREEVYSLPQQPQIPKVVLFAKTAERKYVGLPEKFNSFPEIRY
jgi:hypothetical protein